ncbi:hypothetical protein CHS0354_013121 [Potamilus streckersoni]|uniref:ABC transporter domain-containing protein n=1 Tax=Potamilus streckersoni TaxID=2493646 RepID=A0AAE0VQF0_9BIVA|nr:hypothetical protein CHS0354_013121 [Potamilus streckersoni]
MLDLGFVAFYAVGAYTLGLLSQHAGLGFWSVLPIAGFVTAMFGAVLGFPVLRMHGDYLAIVTLGFGEIIRLFLNNMLELTGGPNGMSVPKITFFGYEFSRSEEETTFSSLFGLEYDSTHQMIFLYLVLFAVCVLAIVFCSKLKKMPIGRAWEALREDEIACRSMGINHVAVKLSAFMLGAMFGGISGVFFAAYQGFINPTSFTFIESVLIVAIVVLGGLGSIPGVIMAAIALNVIPELFREFQDYRIIMFGLAMVIMMLWRPRGLIRIIKNLTMRFGGIVALKDVSFNVPKKSISALIGPNGAGKTTVFNCVTGFYRATEGQLLLKTAKGDINIKKVLGEELSLSDLVNPSQLGEKIFYKMLGGTHRVVQGGLARTFQNIRLFKDMTVVENLLVAQHMRLNRNILAGLFSSSSYKESEQRALEEAYHWLEMLKLTGFAQKLAGALPYGQSRRLEIARAMCTGPEVICLDEPAAGLNPKETDDLTATISLLREKFNITILLIEHDMSMVMRISDYITVLDHGVVIAHGDPKTIENDPQYMTTEQPFLKISGVSAHYGPVQALKNVSLEIHKSEIVTLIGANGAGKSTLLMTIFGNPKPSAGTIIYNGIDITNIDVHHISKLGISQSPEGRRIFLQMTVEENIIIGANSLGDDYIDEDKQKIFEMFPILKQRRNQVAGTLSGGEQQMLAIGRALMSRPKLLLLDEPSLGLAPLIIKNIFETIKQIAQTGTTIFLVEQNAFGALKLADRAYVLVNGEIKMSGKAHDLLDNEDIKKAYLGGH